MLLLVSGHRTGIAQAVIAPPPHEIELRTAPALEADRWWAPAADAVRHI